MARVYVKQEKLPAPLANSASPAHGKVSLAGSESSAIPWR